jgi:DNA cross-link repair 1A protein
VHSDVSRAKMKSWFERWLAERKRRRDAGEPLVVPGRTDDYW